MRAEMGKVPSRAPPSQLNLPPGFRFYPTDEELVVHYLCKRAASEPFSIPIIAEIELYKFDPWDLPERALFGEKEWYFFSPRDRKYPNGSRPNRAAGTGYWKATGTDKPISTMSGSKKVGVKKALVFYKGKAPKGVKTNWIMHEYRLADSAARSAKKKGTLRLDDWVLCRIYKKCSAAQKSPSAKERSESSCLDSALSPAQVSDGNLDSFLEGDFAERGSASGNGLYKHGQASKAMDIGSYLPRNVSELNAMPLFGNQGFAIATAAADDTQTFAAVKKEQQEMSNPDSHVYSNRQTSSPAMSRQEDDAVDSAFQEFPRFPAELDISSFPQWMDTGLLLPSPTMAGQSSFPSLLESDLFTSSDFSMQMRPFCRGSHWDGKVNFATL